MASRTRAWPCSRTRSRITSTNPAAYVALAQIYQDASRGPQAVKLLQDAQAKFPASTSIAFELGAVFDKQKKFAEAETAFRQVLARDPDNAGALNYLGYMLAERGERLDESVGYLKKALEMEPDNGSFLDSLGWAYFKAGKLDLAEDNLRRAADQLKDQLRHPGTLRAGALQGRPVRRRDRGVEPRARRATATRSTAPTSTRRSGTPGKNSTNDETAGARGGERGREFVVDGPRPGCGLPCAAPLMKLPAGPGAPAPTPPTRWRRPPPPAAASAR